MPGAPSGWQAMVSTANRPDSAVDLKLAELSARATAVETAFVAAFSSANLRRPRLWIAYSGGLDSSVLLHLAARQRQCGLIGDLYAVHVNHNMVAESAAWAEHCSVEAARLQVPFTQCQIPAGELTGGNLEQRARQSRYRLIASVMEPDDWLVTAHHRRDQAETLLLQLFRGAGVSGTAAMGAVSASQGIKLLRPLLNVDPDDLRAYARHHQLQWVEDPSNQLPAHDRNYLRHQVMPQLRQRWAGVDQVLARSARLHAQSSEMAEDLAIIDLAKVGIPARPALSEPSQRRLSVAGLLELSLARRSNLLRHWLKIYQHPVPTEAQLLALQQTLLYSRADRSPHFAWQQSEVHRYRGELFVTWQQIDGDEPGRPVWMLDEPLVFVELGRQLSAKLVVDGMRLAWPAEQPLRVLFRRGGETIQLHGHRRKLKKLFQQWGVAPSDRQRLPLVYAGDELLAVPGYAVADSVQVTGDNTGWQLYWQPLLPDSDPLDCKEVDRPTLTGGSK